MALSLVDERERAHPLDGEVFLVGSRPGLDLVVDREEVLAVHLRLERGAAGWTAVAVGPTTLDGDPLSAPTPLLPGALLELGGVRLRVTGDLPATVERSRALALALAGALGGEAGLDVVAGPAAGRRLPLPPPGGELILGREPGCGARLDDPDVSRAHLRLRNDGSSLFVIDLGGKNGTRVDGRRLEPGVPTALVARALVEIGGCRLVYSTAPRPGRRAPALLVLGLALLALAGLVWLLWR